MQRSWRFYGHVFSGLLDFRFIKIARPDDTVGRGYSTVAASKVERVSQTTNKQGLLFEQIRQKYLSGIRTYELLIFSSLPIVFEAGTFRL